MIYENVHEIRLVSIIYDRGDWHRVSGKWPSKKEEARMDGITTYCAACWPHDNPAPHFIVDTATLRADGGFKEIIEKIAELAGQANQ